MPTLSLHTVSSLSLNIMLIKAPLSAHYSQEWHYITRRSLKMNTMDTQRNGFRACPQQLVSHFSLVQLIPRWLVSRAQLVSDINCDLFWSPIRIDFPLVFTHGSKGRPYAENHCCNWRSPYIFMRRMGIRYFHWRSRFPWYCHDWVLVMYTSMDIGDNFYVAIESACNQIP